MSTSWGLYCDDCQVQADGPFINHGEAQLREAMKAWPAVRQLRSMALGWVDEPTVMGQSETPWSFLEEHDGHTISLRSEYGDKEPIDPDDGRRGFTAELWVSAEQRQAIAQELGLDGIAERRTLRMFYRPLLQMAIDSGFGLPARTLVPAEEAPAWRGDGLE